LTNVGFVYLKNHGINRQLVIYFFIHSAKLKIVFKFFIQIEGVFKGSESFFHLPDATKQSYKCDVEICDGYTGRDQEMYRKVF